MRTNPNQTRKPNPAIRFYEWKGSKGVFQYYDKEKKETIEAPANFPFIVLDELSTIKGFNQQTQLSLYSNEVRNLKTQKMFVKYHKGNDLIDGYYNDIKEFVKGKGGKFCKSVYIAIKEGSDLKIANIQFVGSGFDGWMRFLEKSKNELYTGIVELTGSVQEKNGATTYKVPTFAIRPIAPKTDLAAGTLQKELEEYLVDYFKSAGQTEVTNYDRDELDIVIPPDTLFVDDRTTEEIAEQLQAEGKIDVDDDLPF